MNLSANACSIPSRAMFASIGLMMPPWGVPSSVSCHSPCSMNPARRNCASTFLSMGTLASSHSWLMWSKHPFMSPSRTYFGLAFLASSEKSLALASCALRPFLNPNELLSAVVSATGSSASAYSACIALSRIVGIPRGLVSPLFPFFGMRTRRSGFAL